MNTDEGWMLGKNVRARAAPDGVFLMLRRRAPEIREGAARGALIHVPGDAVSFGVSWGTRRFESRLFRTAWSEWKGMALFWKVTQATGTCMSPEQTDKRAFD